MYLQLPLSYRRYTTGGFRVCVFPYITVYHVYDHWVSCMHYRYISRVIFCMLGGIECNTKQSETIRQCSTVALTIRL